MIDATTDAAYEIARTIAEEDEMFVGSGSDRTPQVTTGRAEGLDDRHRVAGQGREALVKEALP